MRKKEEKNTIIEICPVRNVIARFGNKWALLVILILSEHEVLRFSDGEFQPCYNECVGTGTVGYAPYAGGRRTGEPEGVSRGASQGGVQPDGDGTLAGAFHRPADRLGTEAHEIHRETPGGV